MTKTTIKQRIEKVVRVVLLGIVAIPFLGSMVFTGLAALAWMEDHGVGALGFDQTGRPVCVTPVEIRSGDSFAVVKNKLQRRKIDFMIDEETAQMIARTALPWWNLTGPTTLVRIEFDPANRVRTIEHSGNQNGL